MNAGSIPDIKDDGDNAFNSAYLRNASAVLALHPRRVRRAKGRGTTLSSSSKFCLRWAQNADEEEKGTLKSKCLPFFRATFLAVRFEQTRRRARKATARFDLKHIPGRLLFLSETRRILFRATVDLFHVRAYSERFVGRVNNYRTTG